MTEKKIKKLVIGMVVFGFILQGISAVQGLSSVTKLKRPQTGSDAKQVTLIMKGEGVNEEVAVLVDELSPTQEAIEAYLEQAKTEVDESFLGENLSVDCISKNVVVKDSYVDGTVSAVWSFSPGKIITNDGKINFEEVVEDTPVMCTVVLEAYEKELSYTFPVFVRMPDANDKDGFLYYVKKILKEQNEKGKDEEEFYLPTVISGKEVEWRNKVSFTGIEISLLALFMGVLLIFGKKFDEKRELEKRTEEFVRYYPDIISALTLYMGAGLSSQGAFEKIADSYRKQKEKTGVEKGPYEYIVILVREIQDGKNTRNAYEDFGRRCLHPAYKKMMMLFEQNIRKGNEYLLEQLEREERTVYETRQRKIKAAGEVASTKLLVPMGGLLAMVLIVLVVPALFTIQI